jgi:hypothetical protein
MSHPLVCETRNRKLVKIKDLEKGFLTRPSIEWHDHGHLEQTFGSVGPGRRRGDGDRAQDPHEVVGNSERDGRTGRRTPERSRAMTGRNRSDSRIEASMTSSLNSLSVIARCLLLSFAMVILGSAWGCGGGVPSQATLDEEGQKRLQEAQDNMRKSMAKRQEVDRSETKAKAKRR